jgi:hypothetical protein
MSKFRVLALAGLVALASGVVITARSPLAAETKQIIVSIVDTATNMTNPAIMGLGLKGADFAIREDNVDREVVSAEPATAPMSLIYLVDTTSAFVEYVQDERTSSKIFLKEFMAKNPTSSVAIWEFGGQGMPMLDFTTDATKLDATAARIFPKGNFSEALRGHGVGSVLLEALSDSGKELAKRKETRRNIVVLNSDLPVEVSKLPGQAVQDEIVKANATLWAVSLRNIDAANGPKRDNVLNALCPYSGGKRLNLTDVASLENVMKNVADILSSQYVVTYNRPSGAPKQVAVLVKRNGLTATTARWAPK